VSTFLSHSVVNQNSCWTWRDSLLRADIMINLSNLILNR